MKKQMILALSLTILLFSILSGCKTKRKIVQNSSVNTSLESQKADSTKLVISESSQHTNVDSTRKTESSKETSISKKTYEIRLTLDSNKRVLMDTTGNFDIRKLINAGLQNASSLIVKVEDQQSQTKESNHSEQSHKTASDTASKKTDSTGVNKSHEKTKSASKNRNVDVTADSTIAKNSGGAWYLMGISAIVCGIFLIYWLNKRKRV